MTATVAHSSVEAHSPFDGHVPLRHLPFPLNQIPAEGVPLTCCALSDILHPLLAQLEGLALMCYHGARQPDAMLEEVIPAVGLLAELLRVVRSLHTRWEHDNPQLGAP